MDLMQRQSLLIAPGMKQGTAIIGGLGMNGSWIAQSLVRTMRNVIGFDMDTVGAENIGTQAYLPKHIGSPKAMSMSMQLEGFDSFSAEDLKLDEACSFLLNPRPIVVISAIDSFAGRAMMARLAVKSESVLFIDTRTDGTVVTTVSVLPGHIEGYLATLEDDASAPEPACGAEGTAFAGMYHAVQVTSAINRVFKGLPVPYKTVHDVGLDVRLLTEFAQPVKEVVTA